VVSPTMGRGGGGPGNAVTGCGADPDVELPVYGPLYPGVVVLAPDPESPDALIASSASATSVTPTTAAVEPSWPPAGS